MKFSPVPVGRRRVVCEVIIDAGNHARCLCELFVEQRSTPKLKALFYD